MDVVKKCICGNTDIEFIKTTPNKYMNIELFTYRCKPCNRYAKFCSTEDEALKAWNEMN